MTTLPHALAQREGTTPIAPLALMRDLLAAYRAAGASPEAQTAARLLLARGRVFEAELNAVNALDDTDDGDRNLLACLDGLAHLIADGVPLTPLVNQITGEGR